MFVPSRLIITLGNLVDWAPAISGIGSVILTAGLVYLYKIQTEIQEQQKSLTENSHKAILRVDDYVLLPADTVDRTREEMGINTDELISSGAAVVTVSNFGKGAADDLQAELYFDGDLAYLSIETILNYGSRFDPLAHTGDGGVIGAEERETEFVAQFSVSGNKMPEPWAQTTDETSRLSPTEIMTEIQKAGEQVIEVGLRLHYEDGTGEREPKTLLQTKLDMNNSNAFGTIAQRGEPIYE